MSRSWIASLAIGSLLGFGINWAAVGADEPPNPLGGQPAAPDPAEPETDAPPNFELVAKWIRERKYEEAMARLESAIGKDPQNHALGMMYSYLIAGVSRDRSDEAFALIRDWAARGLEKPSPKASELMGIATAVDALVSRDTTLTNEAKLALLAQLQAKLAGDDPRLESSRQTILSRKISILLDADRKDEALAELETMIAAAREERGGSLSSFVRAVQAFQSLGGSSFPERVAELTDEAEAMTAEAVAKDQITLVEFQAYYMLRMNRVSALVRTDPEAAEPMLQELEAALEWAPLKLKQSSEAMLSSYTRSVRSLRARLEAAKKINSLLGTEAPEIDAEHFVASEPVTMETLRGKVVLIDFWAVWCGPCIATFPHLIEWHEKYADKGLVILGATQFYGYRWDDEAGRALRDEKGQVSPATELAMLEKFRESHSLRHGFFVTPEGSTYSAAYGVTGIPHVVLIDQQGKIQMVRIGSGDANARDLEGKIEELLGG